MNHKDNLYYLPFSTEVILAQENPARECENLGLLLDKYVPKSVFEKPGRGNQEAGKTPWLLNILKPKGENKTQNNHINAVFAKGVYNRWDAMMSAMNTTRFNAFPDWRMVIGLGGETVLETDITLHHLYGLPFIPGSALKGLTRAYVTGEIDEHKSQDIDKDDATVQRIFGSQEHAGTVLFFDAMPLNGEVKFVVDIMNPHYPEYYGGNKPPTNDQSPVPVTFLTVTNTTFTFALAPRDASKGQHVKDVELVKGWLQEALQKYGVGGKTSAGYGYFKVREDEHKHESKNEQKLETAPAATQLSPPLPERKPAELPPFQVNQEIMGVVTTPNQRSSLLQRFPMESASVILIYRDSRGKDYNLEDIVLLVSTEHPTVQNWKEKEQRKCQITHIEKRNGCTVLICKPVQSKFSDKKKR